MWNRPNALTDLMAPSVSITNPDGPPVGARVFRHLHEEVDRIITTDLTEDGFPGPTDEAFVRPLSPPEPTEAVFLLSRDLYHHQSELAIVMGRHRYHRYTFYTGVPAEMQRPLDGSATEKDDNEDNASDDIFGQGIDSDLEATPESYWKLISGILAWTRSDTDDAEDRPDPTVSICYAPLLHAQLASDIFTIPACRSIFPSYGSAAATPESELAVAKAFERRVAQAQDVGQILAAYFAGQGLKPEVYSLGRFAKRTAAAMVDAAAQVDGMDRVTPTSVILIDRNLDLVAPAMHGDHILDNILAVLPPFPGTADGDRGVVVDYDEGAKTGGIEDADRPFPYSLNVALAQQSPPSSSQDAVTSPRSFLDQLRGLNQRAGLILIRKRLADTLAQAQVKVKLPKALGKVTPAQLQKALNACRNRPDLWQGPMGSALVLATAAVTTLRAAAERKWDEVVGLEKVLCLTTNEDTDDGAEVLARVLDILPDAETFPSEWLPFDATAPGSGETVNTLLHSDGRPTYALDTIMSLLLIAYSIVGDAAAPSTEANPLAHHEAAFRERLEEAFGRWLSLRAPASAAGATQKARFSLYLETAFQHLRAVAEARQGLAHFRHLHRPQTAQSYVPLLVQVAEALGQSWNPSTKSPAGSRATSPTGQAGPALSPEQSARVFADLQPFRRGGGQLSNYLTGFGRLIKSTATGAAGRHPFDNPGPVYIFVTGGLTFWEIQMFRERIIADIPQAPEVSCVTDIETGHGREDMCLRGDYTRIPALTNATCYPLIIALPFAQIILGTTKITGRRDVLKQPDMHSF
ncbi:Sec1 domain-containing protein 2 [Tieghemiomyces parasiticus]|uniref:Sec1 domain-containing protein 2 n=1 Tax=Tieghemiomyces parasiticus TaxID=78921 RepID=A0A9W7ZFX4_9FUNG|nr:Sec1 domain-containing protein 2 [Tieghemiomyces parasiticus]